METKFFPVSLRLDGQKVLILGAGRIARRKVESLLKYGAQVRVLGKEIKEDILKQWKEEGRIELEEGELRLEDLANYLEDVFLVVAATDDSLLNQKVADYCMARAILVNNVSSKAEMNLRFMSLFETEDIQIAVSANGNPKKAKQIRELLENFFKSQAL